MKPAVAGMPASEKRQSVRTAEANGARRPSPASSPIGMRLRLVAVQGRDGGERAGVGDEVGEEVDDRRRERRPAEDDERDRDVAHVRDAGVGEQPLDVALRERHDVAERHREDRDAPRFPSARRPGQSSLKDGGQDAVEDDEARALGSDGEVGDGGRRHSLVDVRRPGVERRERHLEAEPGEQQEERERHDRIGSEADLRQRRDPHAPALSEEEGDAVQRERRAEGARQEVLQPGLGGGRDGAEERGEDVEGEREGLEADEDEEQVESRGP